jgi:hypothetical protein
MNNRQFVFVTIVTFIVIVIWIIADILHTRPSVEVNPKLNTLLTPVNPNFNPKIIAQISEVSSVSQSNSSIPVNTSLPVPSIATPSSEATNAAQTGGNQ